VEPNLIVPWNAARPPRAVGLDLMDTLIRDPWREVVERLIGMTVEDSRALRDREAWSDFELGLIGEEGYRDRFFLPHARMQLDVERLRREFQLGYGFVEGMEALLAELAARLPVHILSNYPPWYEDVRSRFLLDRYVAGHHPSYLLGARKPSPDYFGRALARAALRPDEILFVDDREENILAARELGIPSVVFTGAADLRTVLAAGGILS
jgi:FMN phosphatase YigB (HAD superfamily)